MRTLAKILGFEIVPDAKLAPFAAGFCWVAAGVTFLLGYRYVAELRLPPAQHLLGLVVLLILCLALGAVGTLSHVRAMLKSMRAEQSTAPR